MGVSQAELDALRIAIDTEKEGYHFFKKAKEMAKTEITRDLFDTLMKDELLHQKVIEEYYRKLTNEGSRKEVKEVEAELQKSSGTFKTIDAQPCALRLALGLGYWQRRHWQSRSSRNGHGSLGFGTEYFAKTCHEYRWTFRI
jgi:rubrerythrin